MSRHRMLRIAAVPLLLAVAQAARADLKVGDRFPSLDSFGLVNLAGGGVPTVAGKVTLVDFWASWCAPCKASFPAMSKIYEDLGPRGLQIVAISIDEKHESAVRFWRRMAPPFTALHDPGQKLVAEVVVPTMPTSYLLDRSGRVRFIRAGFHGDLDELRREIKMLLAEKDEKP